MDTHYDYCVINKKDNTITLYNKDKYLDIYPLDVNILLMLIYHLMIVII
jgi:hypothetical protein